jgi:ribonucleoside-diphosphate reductase alpha chain
MTVEQWLGSDNLIGISIWGKKYKQEGETFDQWLDRVSSKDDKVKQLILRKKFLLGGRALANRAVEGGGSLFNCYSVGYCPDDLEGIFEINTILGMTYKAQGGQGVSLSKLRPKGAPVGKLASSDGIVPFMELFSQTTKSISQGGSRKGALMISLDIRHKEAETFITLKSDLNQITKANLSLEIDDEFMAAVQHYYETGEEITLHESRTYSGHLIEYDIIPIRLYKLMIQMAYDYGEPGCLFTERFRNYNLMEKVAGYEIETANPCGEQCLPKHGCCNLGSLNLSQYVLSPFTKDATFDYPAFKDDIGVALYTLDRLIDENLNNHAIVEQRNNSFNYRNIGLGVMGYASCLMKLGLQYGTEEALRFTDVLFNFMFRNAVYADLALGMKFGAFPKYSPEMWESEIIKQHFTPEEINKLKQYGFRNCSLLSIAPTGSIGTMLNEPGGIEPEFALSFTRRTEALGEESYEVKCKSWREYQEVTNKTDKPNWLVSAPEIDWRDRIATQSIIQQHIDTAISSTVNLPQEITAAEVETLYLEAWKAGLKGITVFRAGCARAPILTSHDKEKKEENSPESTRIELDKIIPVSRKLMDSTYGITYCKKCACGTIYITINCNENGDIVECFAYPAKNGGCKANIEGLTRLLSAGLRGGIKVEELADQLKGIQCGACIKVQSLDKNLDGISCPDIISKTLQNFYDVNNFEFKVSKDKKEKTPSKFSLPKEIDILESDDSINCPECHKELGHSGGCVVCGNCGYSKCN